MKECIEARKISANDTDTDTFIQMEYDIPIDKKEKDTKNLTKEDKEAKIKAFKDKYGTGYKYHIHTCYHDENNRHCELQEI